MIPYRIKGYFISDDKRVARVKELEAASVVIEAQKDLLTEKYQEFYKAMNCDEFKCKKELENSGFLKDEYIRELAKLKSIDVKVNKEISFYKSFEGVSGTLKEEAKERAKDILKGFYKSGKLPLEEYNEINGSKTEKGQTKYADVMVLTKDQELLVMKRSLWEDKFQGAWVIPGGHVDEGEDDETAAKRELLEETGISLDKLMNDDHIVQKPKWKQIGVYEDKDAHISYFLLDYLDPNDVEILLDDAETRDYKWVPRREIDEYKMVFNMADNVKHLLKWDDDEKIDIIRKAIEQGVIPIHMVNDIAKAYISKASPDELDGGKADGKSLQDIADKHKVNLTVIEQEYNIGVPIEFEHTDKLGIAQDITKDHLWEIPDYYTRLKKMEADSNIEKSMNHKYIRKEPDGNGGWNYIYEEPKNAVNRRDINKKGAIYDYKSYFNKYAGKGLDGLKVGDEILHEKNDGYIYSSSVKEITGDTVTYDYNRKTYTANKSEICLPPILPEIIKKEVDPKFTKVLESNKRLIYDGLNKLGNEYWGNSHTGFIMADFDKTYFKVIELNDTEEDLSDAYLLLGILKDGKVNDLPVFKEEEINMISPSFVKEFYSKNEGEYIVGQSAEDDSVFILAPSSVYEEKKGKQIDNKEENNNYESIRDSAKQIVSGERKLKRLSQAEELGRIAGGTRAIEATLLLRGSEGSGGENQRSDAKRQEEILIKYAEDNDLMMDVNGDPKYEYISSGAESRVYYDTSEPNIEEGLVSSPGSVIKVVDYSAFSSTPLEHLDNRIALHNFLFPESAYELIGFHRYSNGNLNFVVKQPFIQGIPVSVNELTEEMEKRGFESPSPRLYLNDNYVIDDLHPGNMVKTENGNIIIFDPIVSLRTSEEEGNRVYSDIEIE